MGKYPELAGGLKSALLGGLVIPAHPLALDRRRRFDERRQRALTRYYLASGAGGLAVGVHTTQFEIRDPKVGLLKPVLSQVAETARTFRRRDNAPTNETVMIAGICGRTSQACSEAEWARELGYCAGLLSLSAWGGASDAELLRHCEAVARELPIVGFYLQPAAGGRLLSRRFWRGFCEIPNVVAIKIAPFNRYQTWDVIHAVAESGRGDIALYTGNDDTIVQDLLTPYRVRVGGRVVELRMVGGLLGQWAVGTRSAVEMHGRCRELARRGLSATQEMLGDGASWTDINGAVFDAANGFRGCIVGIQEVLRRQGLLATRLTLNHADGLGRDQARELDRVMRDYREMLDGEYVERHRDEWLKD